MKLRPVLFSSLSIIAVWAILLSSVRAAEAPEVFISLRGVTNNTVTIGEPLFIGVRLETPFESTTPLKLPGDWRKGVVVELARDEGAAEALPAQPLFSAENEETISLDADHAASAEWLVSSASTQPLAAGDYRLRVRWARPNSSDEATSEAVPVRLIATTATDVAQGLERTLALATEALHTTQLPEAARLVDPLLTTQPDNLRLLMLRAKISAQAGDLRGAMICLNRAMDSDEVAQAKHPPLALFELEQQVATALLAEPLAASALPDWVRLPASVMQPRLPASK